MIKQSILFRDISSLSGFTNEGLIKIFPLPYSEYCQFQFVQWLSLANPVLSTEITIFADLLMTEAGVPLPL